MTRSKYQPRARAERRMIRDKVECWTVALEHAEVLLAWQESMWPVDVHTHVADAQAERDRCAAGLAEWKAKL